MGHGVRRCLRDRNYRQRDGSGSPPRLRIGALVMTPPPLTRQRNPSGADMRPCYGAWASSWPAEGGTASPPGKQGWRHSGRPARKRGFQPCMFAAKVSSRPLIAETPHLPRRPV